eukprot:4306065-Amphidinium_carterae.1
MAGRDSGVLASTDMRAAWQVGRVREDVGYSALEALHFGASKHQASVCMCEGNWSRLSSPSGFKHDLAWFSLRVGSGRVSLAAMCGCGSLVSTKDNRESVLSLRRSSTCALDSKT